MRDIVVDTHRELVHRLGSGEVLVDGENLSRSGVLGGETETTADDHRGFLVVLESFHHVEVQRIAVGTGFFRSVENADTFHALRHHSHEVFHAERTIEVHADETEFLTGFVLLVDDGFDDIGDGAHGDDDIGGIFCAVEGERSIFTTRDLAQFLHVFGDDVGKSIVILVLQLSGLEVDIGVLGGTAGHGVFRIQGALTILLEGFPVEELLNLALVSSFHFLDFVGGAETVEEVQERDTTLDSGQVSHRSEVHDLLHGAGSQHGETGLASAHHVGVVTEDGQSLSGEGTCGDVEDARKELTSNLVHVGDHQQETL